MADFQALEYSEVVINQNGVIKTLRIPVTKKKSEQPCNIEIAPISEILSTSDNTTIKIENTPDNKDILPKHETHDVECISDDSDDDYEPVFKQRKLDHEINNSADVMQAQVAGDRVKNILLKAIQSEQDKDRKLRKALDKVATIVKSYFPAKVKKNEDVTKSKKDHSGVKEIVTPNKADVVNSESKQTPQRGNASKNNQQNKTDNNTANVGETAIKNLLLSSKNLQKVQTNDKHQIKHPNCGPKYNVTDKPGNNVVSKQQSPLLEGTSISKTSPFLPMATTINNKTNINISQNTVMNNGMGVLQNGYVNSNISGVNPTIFTSPINNTIVSNSPVILNSASSGIFKPVNVANVSEPVTLGKVVLQNATNIQSGFGNGNNSEFNFPFLSSSINANTALTLSSPSGGRFVSQLFSNKLDQASDAGTNTVVHTQPMSQNRPLIGNGINPIIIQNSFKPTIPIILGSGTNLLMNNINNTVSPSNFPGQNPIRSSIPIIFSSDENFTINQNNKLVGQVPMNNTFLQNPTILQNQGMNGNPIQTALTTPVFCSQASTGPVPQTLLLNANNPQSINLPKSGTVNCNSLNNRNLNSSAHPMPKITQLQDPSKIDNNTGKVRIPQDNINKPTPMAIGGQSTVLKPKDIIILADGNFGTVSGYTTLHGKPHLIVKTNLGVILSKMGTNSLPKLNEQLEKESIGSKTKLNKESPIKIPPEWKDKNQVTLHDKREGYAISEVNVSGEKHFLVYTDKGYEVVPPSKLINNEKNNKGPTPLDNISKSTQINWEKLSEQVTFPATDQRSETDLKSTGKSHEGQLSKGPEETFNDQVKQKTSMATSQMENAIKTSEKLIQPPKEVPKSIILADGAFANVISTITLNNIEYFLASSLIGIVTVPCWSVVDGRVDINRLKSTHTVKENSNVNSVRVSTDSHANGLGKIKSIPCRSNGSGVKPLKSLPKSTKIISSTVTKTASCLQGNGQTEIDCIENTGRTDLDENINGVKYSENKKRVDIKVGDACKGGKVMVNFNANVKLKPCDVTLTKLQLSPGQNCVNLKS